MRLALSKDKEGVLALAHEGQKVQTPEDVVKSTYTLEFLEALKIRSDTRKEI